MPYIPSDERNSLLKMDYSAISVAIVADMSIFKSIFLLCLRRFKSENAYANRIRCIFY